MLIENEKFEIIDFVDDSQICLSFALSFEQYYLVTKAKVFYEQ